MLQKSVFMLFQAVVGRYKNSNQSARSGKKGLLHSLVQMTVDEGGICCLNYTMTQYWFHEMLYNKKRRVKFFVISFVLHKFELNIAAKIKTK